MTTMITFNELRQIKDMLPSGSMQKIADELGLDVETVRNYFGGDCLLLPVETIMMRARLSVYISSKVRMGA